MASKKPDVPKTVSKLIPIKVHGAKMGAKPKPVKDRDGDDFSYYHEGRNEPKPPDACLVSAVKPRKQEYETVTVTTKNKAQRDATVSSNMAAMFGDFDAPADSEPRGIPLSTDHEEYKRGLLKK